MTESHKFNWQDWYKAKEIESLRGRRRNPVNAQDRALAVRILAEAHRRLRTWQAVAEHYKISKAAAYRIVNDEEYRPSQVALGRVIDNGIPPIKRLTVDPCPDCGAVHTGRCHGKPVVDVVTLEPGQHVISPLPEGYLLAVNGTAQAVRCSADIRQCGCGEWFVSRSWNQKRCHVKCKGVGK